MNIKKSFTTFELVNIYAFFNEVFKQEQAKELPTKIRWNLKKNLEKIAPISNQFEEFRNNLLDELQKEWFIPEKTEDYMETKKDQDGNVVLDDAGNEVAEKMLKIKDEFLADYQDAINELNTKLQDILAEKNEIEISSVDIDSFVDELPDDSAIDFDALTMLQFMDDKTNITGEA